MNVRKVAIVILASGFSKRYGKNKLLEKIEGEPILNHVVENATGSGSHEIIVIIEPGNEEIRAMIPQNVQIVENEGREEGISSAIRCGVGNVSDDTEGILFMVGDQPFVDSWTVVRMISVFSSGNCDIVSCSCKGDIRNPMLFGRQFFDELLSVRGDQGAKRVALLHPNEICRIEVGEDVLFDIDRPEDLKRANDTPRKRDASRGKFGD